MTSGWDSDHSCSLSVHPSLTDLLRQKFKCSSRKNSDQTLSITGLYVAYRFPVILNSQFPNCCPSYIYDHRGRSMIRILRPLPANHGRAPVSKVRSMSSQTGSISIAIMQSPKIYSPEQGPGRESPEQSTSLGTSYCAYGV